MLVPEKSPLLFWKSSNIAEGLGAMIKKRHKPHGITAATSQLLYGFNPRHPVLDLIAGVSPHRESAAVAIRLTAQLMAIAAISEKAYPRLRCVYSLPSDVEGKISNQRI